MLYVGIALFPVGMVVAFVLTEIVFKVNASARAKLLMALCFAGALCMLVLGPMLLYVNFDDKRRIRLSREALDDGNYAEIYDHLYPVLQTVTCNQPERGDEVIALVAEMYSRLNVETSINEIAELHNEYIEVYEEHKNHEGGVDDPKVSKHIRQVFARCRELCKELPKPA